MTAIITTATDAGATVAREQLGSRGPRTGRRRRPSAWHLVLAPIALLFVLPFAQMFLASVSPAKELIAFPPPFFPSRLDFSGYATLFAETDVLRWLANTVIVSASAIVSHLVLCSLAGYGFARLRFRGRTVGIFLIIATIMIPTQLLMIPTYILFARLGLIDALGAAIVPWLASAFGIFLMRQFFLSIPDELLDAARMDGAGEFFIFFRIALPLVGGGLATLAIFVFLYHWNEVLWTMTVTRTAPDLQTVPVGIYLLRGAFEQEATKSLQRAAIFVSVLPVIIVFLALQRYYVASVTSGSVKG